MSTLQIDPECLSNPFSKPVAALMKIDEGIIFLDPNQVGPLGAGEVQLLLKFSRETEIKFEIPFFGQTTGEELVLGPKQRQTHRGRSFKPLGSEL